MFKSQQHREKAAAYGELIKHSSGQGENDKFQKLGNATQRSPTASRDWLMTMTAP